MAAVIPANEAAEIAAAREKSRRDAKLKTEALRAERQRKKENEYLPLLSSVFFNFLAGRGSNWRS